MERERQTKVFTVDGIAETRQRIAQLVQEGFPKEQIFVLTHDKKRTEEVSEQTDGGIIGLNEEGIINAIADLFRSTGDGLRAKLRAMGVSKEYADWLEKQMDKGKIVVLGWTGILFDNENYDRDITYHPTDAYIPMT